MRREDEKIEEPASFCPEMGLTVWRFIVVGATFAGLHPSQTPDLMPTITPKTDPERSLEPEEVRTEPEAEPAVPGAPLTFVPHDPESAKPIRIRTNRYGDLEEHELIRLLDTIEDERARSRFRESIYISLFVWLAIAWVVLYGPRYLWHAPPLINPADVLRQREMVELNPPTLPHMHTPAAHPTPKPTLDNKTLEHLRAMSPPPPPAPVAQPTPAAPNVPPPTTPTVAPPRPSQPIADAPTPQPTTRPNFSTPGTAQDAIQQAIQSAAKHPGGGGAGNSGSSSPLNTGVDILSDTQGVNFNPYISRILREIYQQWLPLIPEEARPPLSKQGETLIRFSILPDGTIGAMHLDGSTHDGALDRAAWGSITGVGQFPPLPKQFTGPNLELRIHYLVNKTE